MKRKIISRRAGVMTLAAMVLCASCRVTRNYERPPDIVQRGLYRGVDTTDTSSIASVSWRLMFADPLLQALIGEGIANNNDLQIAFARLQQAEASYQQSRLAFLPGINGTASATQQKVATSGLGVPYSYSLFPSVSWDVDLWGQLRSSKRASLAQLLQQDAFRRAVQTQLVANIAMNYYSLLAYDRQLSITEQTVAVRRKDVETVKALKESDFLTGADVAQSEANRYSAEVTIPDIKRNIRETENALCILLGRAPGPIGRGTLDEQQVRTDLRTGVPSQLLANRPDVQQAEYQLRYYFELTNVARTYFYPSLMLTGQAGLSGNSLGNLLNPPAFFASLSENLTQPIFSRGQNRARLRIAEAQQREFLTAFRQALLTAGEEVSNALYSYQAASEKIVSRTQQISFLERAVDFTKELMRYGYNNVNYTDVLTSEQNLLSAQLNGISDKLQQLQAVVSLYRSLGGGWR